MREHVSNWRDAEETIALVPTMGNLHAGHLSLMRFADTLADRVVCSIFVNPTQFGPNEDVERYPRSVSQDEAMLADQGHVDLLFLPDVDSIYPYGTDSAVSVRLPPLSEDLCGASRPGHFDGVASVVLRLLNLISPNILVLGDKDHQQRVLLERMIEDLHLPIQVVAEAIHREPDGLALEAATRRRLTESGFNPDYVAVRRTRDLAPPEVFEPGDERVVLAAAWLGRARLIDNVRV
jgi:pantoate--beta-alanine ligase